MEESTRKEASSEQQLIVFPHHGQLSDFLSAYTATAIGYTSFATPIFI
jgi:hypothetical protein